MPYLLGKSCKPIIFYEFFFNKGVVKKAENPSNSILSYYFYRIFCSKLYKELYGNILALHYTFLMPYLWGKSCKPIIFYEFFFNEGVVKKAKNLQIHSCGWRHHFKTKNILFKRHIAFERWQCHLSNVIKIKIVTVPSCEIQAFTFLKSEKI